MHLGPILTPFFDYYHLENKMDGLLDECEQHTSNSIKNKTRPQEN